MDNKLYTAQAVFFSTSNRTDSVTNFTSIATNFYQTVTTLRHPQTPDCLRPVSRSTLP